MYGSCGEKALLSCDLLVVIDLQIAFEKSASIVASTCADLIHHFDKKHKPAIILEYRFDKSEDDGLFNESGLLPVIRESANMR